MEHGETFYGISSSSPANEYWKKADGTYSSDSSDDSVSSCKEYRDASCNVDYDELDEIIGEDESDIKERISWNSVNSIQLKAKTNVEKSKRSRYVRWDVLMSLGIGLWAVLCIVDIFHSDESVTRGWLYESLRGKKNVSQIVPTKKQESHISWLSNLLLYLWKIISILSASEVYVLLFLLLILFYAEPRLRKSAGHAPAKSSSNNEILPAKQVRDSIVETQNKHISLCRNLPVTVDRLAPKVDPARVESSPAIYLHSRILSTFEIFYCDKLSELENKFPPGFETTSAKILHASSQTDGRNLLGINKSLVAQLDIAGYGPFEFTNSKVNSNFIAEQQSIATINQTDSSDGTFAVRTFHLKIEEYRKLTKHSTDSSSDAFASVREIETTRNSVELSNIEKGKKRIITSSPAFKKFLSSLKPSDITPLAITATPIMFRNNLQDTRL